MYGKTENNFKEGLEKIEENWGNSVNSKKHELQGTAKRYSENVSYLTKKLINNLKDNLKSKPFEGIVMSIGIGLIIGYLFSRK